MVSKSLLRINQYIIYPTTPDLTSFSLPLNHANGSSLQKNRHWPVWRRCPTRIRATRSRPPRSCGGARGREAETGSCKEFPGTAFSHQCYSKLLPHRPFLRLARNRNTVSLTTATTLKGLVQVTSCRSGRPLHSARTSQWGGGSTVGARNLTQPRKSDCSWRKHRRRKKIDQSTFLHLAIIYKQSLWGQSSMMRGDRLFSPSIDTRSLCKDLVGKLSRTEYRSWILQLEHLAQAFPS